MWFVIERATGQVIGHAGLQRLEQTPEVELGYYLGRAAGLMMKAAGYLLQAGQGALRLAANEEAINHFRQGLTLLKPLPDTAKRGRQELALQTALGAPLLATQGFAAPPVEQAFGRAHELCRQLGEPPELFPVLWGLWLFYLVRAQHDTARELA